MEENADGQMETDVSSTTQDTPPPQGPPEPSSSVEVSVVVTGMSLKEEVPETTVDKTDTQDQHIDKTDTQDQDQPIDKTDTQDQHIDSNSMQTPTSSSVDAVPAVAANQPDEVKSDSSTTTTSPTKTVDPVKAVGLLVSPTKSTEPTNASGNISMRSLDLSPAKGLEKPVCRVIKLKRTPSGAFQKSPELPTKKVAVNTTMNTDKSSNSTEISPTKTTEKTSVMSPGKAPELINNSPTKIPEKTKVSEPLPAITNPEKAPETSNSSEKIPEVPVNKETRTSPSKITDKTPDNVAEKAPTKTPTNPLPKVTKIIMINKPEKPVTKTVTTPVSDTPEKTPTKSTDKIPANDKMAGNTPKATKSLNDSNEDVVMVPVDCYADKEASNDSQTDMASIASESSEKEHNKSISREMKSLMKAAKDSKIISEALKTKTRKSRTLLDSSNTSLNTSNLEAEKVLRRRESTNSLISNSSEKSDKVAVKRTMRSQNPEFVTKQKQFLSTVTGKVQKDDVVSKTIVHVSPTPEKKKENPSDKSPSTPAKSKAALDVAPKSGKLKSDLYCWRCHYSVEPAANDKTLAPGRCTVCPRAFHYKCLSMPERNKLATEKNWVCPKCLTVMHAESSETRSPLMRKVSLGMLCELLNYALQRMMELNGVEPFLVPVDRATFPDYDRYIVKPVDLSLMQANIAAGMYGSTEAFVGDAQWILHNSIIFNTPQSKLTAAARALVRSCRAECGEVEACPECYAAAHARRPTWFTDVCSTPHILLWAKLKGFPYWPAKGMSVNSSGMVDVRFFGAHDRAWVPARDCFLYSEQDPNNFRARRQDILDSMQEAEQHIRSISRKFGKFAYQEFKTPLNPAKIDEQLKRMIPSYEGAAVPRKKSTPPRGRNTPKGSKDATNDGGKSDDDEPSSVKRRKVADDADKASEIKDSDKKEKPMEVVAAPSKASPRKRRKSTMESAKPTEVDAAPSRDSLRKRRKSALEEASTITVMSPGPAKRTRLVSAEMTILDSSKNEAKETPSAPKPEIGKIIVKLDPKGTGKPIIVVKPKDSPKVTDKAEATTPKAAEKAEDKAIPTPKLIEKGEAKATSTPKSKSDLEKKTEITDTTPRATRSATPSTTPANKQANKTPKETENAKKGNTVQREKATSRETEKSADDKQKPKRDRPSRSNTSLTSAAGPSKPDQKSKTNINNQENTNKAKSNESLLKRNATKSAFTSSTPKKSIKDNLFFDDDETSLAVLKKNPMLITNVRSISQNDLSKKNADKTPTSTDNTAKPQQLRTNPETTLVGRVGVRAFARMTSPEKDKMEVEVKAEPIDVDELERQKADLLNSIQLQPVNTTANTTAANSTTTANLRQMRITRTDTPTTSAPIKKPIIVKPAEVRPKARKTFPQPQKAVEGRSELNSKNSMVYIPIQPPPVRPPARTAAAGEHAAATVLRPPMIVTAGSSSKLVSTSTNPRMTVVPSSMASSSVPPLTTIGQSTVQMGMAPMSTVGPLGPMGLGQVSTSVHSVPLITSVNGQWTFSLQPMMSVGGVDDIMNNQAVSVYPHATPPALVNGDGAAPTPAAPAAAPLPNRTAEGASGEQPPRLVQKLANPLDPATPAAEVPAPSSAGPVTAKLNQHAAKQPPWLVQKLANPLDPATPAAEVPAPSSAGPVTAKLNQHAAKLAELFRSLLADSLDKLDSPAATVTSLRAQLEQATWRHKQEVEELRHNYELLMSEMRTSLEKEKARVVAESRRSVQQDLVNAVKHAKSRQWCANCQKEAQFYCCWNTSYCDYPCQRAHWAQHFATCTQARTLDNGDNNSVDLTEDRLQPPENPPALKKTTQQPTMNIPRTYQVPNNQPNQGKPSIIVSMVEDSVKCLGTYKPAGGASPSILINKQIMNEETANAQKKMVSSGGYLIVGAGATGGPSVVIN